MGEIAEFSLPVRLFLKGYRWRRIDPVPEAPLSRPLGEARLMLVSSAGLTAPGQAPFDERVRGGDSSFRVLPAEVEVASLASSHRSDSFDPSGVASDPNLGFPLERLRELVASGRLGALARRHLSFMGSLTAVARFLAESVPAMAAIAVEEKVDVALLVPI